MRAFGEFVENARRMDSSLLEANRIAEKERDELRRQLTGALADLRDKNALIPRLQSSLVSKNAELNEAREERNSTVSRLELELEAETQRCRAETTATKEDADRKLATMAEEMKAVLRDSTAAREKTTRELAELKHEIAELRALRDVRKRSTAVNTVVVAPHCYHAHGDVLAEPPPVHWNALRVS